MHKWSPSLPVDVIYEQTCLCALHPDHWMAYAAQLRTWLRLGGCLAALFVQMLKEGALEGYVTGPSYHCDIHAIRTLFPATSWDWPKPPMRALSIPAAAWKW